MSKDNVVALSSPEGVEDPLTELLRTCAKRLIQQAIEAELAELLVQYGERVDDEGRRAVVRNGYLPEREILTGVEPVPVKVAKVVFRILCHFLKLCKKGVIHEKYNELRYGGSRRGAA